MEEKRGKTCNDLNLVIIKTIVLPGRWTYQMSVFDLGNKVLYGTLRCKLKLATQSCNCH